MIAVNCLTKVITIPQADLTLVSATVFQLDIQTLKGWLAAWEMSDDGMGMPNTFSHNPPVILSGVTYAATITIINGYTITFQDTGSAYTVKCVGANHNLADVVNFSKVSLIVGNSAGLITVNTAGGGGATAADVWNYGARTLTSAAPPTASEISAAIGSAALEGSFTRDQVMRLVAAALAGTSQKTGSTVVFKGIDGVTDRITGSFDAQNNRTGAVLNGA